MLSRLLTSALTLLLPLSLRAQWIPIKTTPLTVSDFSEMLPSSTRAMGNASIALPDTLGDPFVNPATATRLQGLTIFASPTRSSWTNDPGQAVITRWGVTEYPGQGINTLPVGAYLHSSEIMAGAFFAYQKSSAEHTRPYLDNFYGLTHGLPGDVHYDGGENFFLFGLFGYEPHESGLSLATSVMWARYRSIDGVNLLFPGMNSLDQRGSMWELKVGAYEQLNESDIVELVGARRRFLASYYAAFSRGYPSVVVSVPSTDAEDEWLVRARYSRAFGPHWTLGALFAVNWKDYPTLPVYAPGAVPPGSGNAAAYNLGMGAAWSDESRAVVFEYAFEPILSRMRMTAVVQDNPGGFLPVLRTTENRFRFSDHLLRVGLLTRTSIGWLDWSVGSQLHYYSYALTESDRLTASSEDSRKDWLEPLVTGGLTVRFSRLALVYTFGVSLGAGVVGPVTPPQSFGIFDSTGGSDVIVPRPTHTDVDPITRALHQLIVAYHFE